MSSLTLKLSARQYLYKNRDKILKDPYFLYGDNADIGSGQATVGYLGPGKTTYFSMAGHIDHFSYEIQAGNFAGFHRFGIRFKGDGLKWTD